MADESFKQSEFNMAVNYLMRLNTLLSSCVQAAVNLQMSLWYHSLWGLLSELSTRMESAEYDNFDKRLSEIQKSVDQADTKQMIDFKLYRDLKCIEKDLRAIIKRAGLESRDIDSQEDMI